MAEESGEAIRDTWYGFLFPVVYPLKLPLYHWPTCPFCNGEIREGLRTEILRAPELTSDEGEE